jgi:hypothetical protein
VVLRHASTAVAALLTGAVLAGCGGGDATPPTPPKPTPLASYDGTVAHVQRVSFCSRIPDAAVADAVGDKVTTSHYGNGERLPGSEDVSHEYGCVFTGSDVVARSWVFVPPVTPARAAELASAARGMPGCAEVPAAKFGSPAVGTLCHGGGRATVTFRGLFGDAWLACSLAAPTTADTPAGTRAAAEEALVAKAGNWCVQVATTASAS